MSDKDENESAILRLDESMSLDEPEGAAAQTEPPESPEVCDVVTPGSQDKEVQTESGPLDQISEVSSGTGSQSHSQRRHPRPIRRRSPEYHGPWRYGEFEWRCEVPECKMLDPLVSFESLEKHFIKRHNNRRVEYVCVFQGPSCFRNPKHDLVREHSRNAARHQRIPKLERFARTEHMPWIIAVNPDYIWDIPDLPKNPIGGQVLDPTPHALPFAEKASPLADTRESRSAMIRHDGAYASAVKNDQRREPPITRPVSSQQERGATGNSFPARDIRSGVMVSRSIPEEVQYTDSVFSCPHHRQQPPQREETIYRRRIEAYQREEEAVRTELVAVRQEMELLRAREALLRNRQELLWQDHQRILMGLEKEPW